VEGASGLGVVTVPGADDGLRRATVDEELERLVEGGRLRQRRRASAEAYLRRLLAAVVRRLVAALTKDYLVAASGRARRSVVRRSRVF